MNYTSSVQPLSRREMLRTSACGFGSLALAGLCQQAAASTGPATLLQRQPMIAPRAKRGIFIFMAGGPSHVDSYDYKPELIRNHDKDYDFTGVRFGTFGKKSKRKLMKPLWDFKQYGQCGQHVSELFPYTAQMVDDLCFIKSMHTEGVAHGPSTLFMHTGATNLIRPSVGSWVTYGLGSERSSLPAFVVMNDYRGGPLGGPNDWSAGFMPATYQGTLFRAVGDPIVDLQPPEGMTEAQQRARLDTLATLNEIDMAKNPGNSELAARISSYELAYRMQGCAPEAVDTAAESDATKKLYGLDDPLTEPFGRQCLMARRLVERGVRFVQLFSGNGGGGTTGWDAHTNLKDNHSLKAAETDLPIAGLLTDLKSRGLLDSTLLVWHGEFGRMPISQRGVGRDHNPGAMTGWMAGAGIQGGQVIGATDKIAGEVVSRPVHYQDVVATLYHNLGIDVRTTTIDDPGGRPQYLTDGRLPIQELI